LGYVTQLVEDKDTTIQRLRQILFGASTEKTTKVFPSEVGSPQAEAGAGAAETSTPEGGDGVQGATAPRKGHGRNGAKAYGGGQKVQVSHSQLKTPRSLPGVQKRQAV
jgi:hypothetical protein